MLYSSFNTVNKSIQHFRLNLFDKSTQIDEKAIINYNKLINSGTHPLHAFTEASKNANTATLELLKSANGSIITNDQLSAAIDKTTLSAKLAGTALKGLGAAGGMLAFAAVTAAVSAAAKAIDNYIHRNEILLEKAQASSQKIQEISENFQSQRELVESCAASYDRLSEASIFPPTKMSA